MQYEKHIYIYIYSKTRLEVLNKKRVWSLINIDNNNKRGKKIMFKIDFLAGNNSVSFCFHVEAWHNMRRAWL